AGTCVSAVRVLPVQAARAAECGVRGGDGGRLCQRKDGGAAAVGGSGGICGGGGDVSFDEMGSCADGWLVRRGAGFIAVAYVRPRTGLRLDRWMHGSDRLRATVLYCLPRQRHGVHEPP